MSHPGVLPASPPQEWSQPPPPPPRRDSTRTIAIVALVVAGVALAGQLATMVLPMLFFGVFGPFGLSDGFADEGFGSSGGIGFGGGQVSPAVDGTVSAAALTEAVRELVDVDDPLLPPVDRITCDAAPRIAEDVSVLCRSTPEQWYFIVRFVDGSGEFDVQAVEGIDMTGMP